MYGSHIGTLNIYTRTSTTGAMNRVWTLSGDQGDQWIRGNATINVNQNFQVKNVL